MQPIEQIYTSFRDRLKQFIMGRIRDADTAEDILHDVFLKIHNNIHTLQDESKLESWIFRITRNEIIDHTRSRKHIVDDVENLPTEVDDDRPYKKIAESLSEMIDTLPSPYREALILTEVEGISQKELAQRLGISVSGAKSRVQRARRMLKETLLECCHFEFDMLGKIIDYYPRECRTCKDNCEI
jgi:RNA polymerase sigma-70 factor, ECF subfamily